MTDSLQGTVEELAAQIDTAVFIKMQEAVTTQSPHGILIEWPKDIFSDEKSDENVVLLNGPAVYISAEVPHLEVHERIHGQTEKSRSRSLELSSMNAFVRSIES